MILIYSPFFDSPARFDNAQNRPYVLFVALGTSFQQNTIKIIGLLVVLQLSQT